jgi:hypothetical protein
MNHAGDPGMMLCKACGQPIRDEQPREPSVQWQEPATAGTPGTMRLNAFVHADPKDCAPQK